MVRAPVPMHGKLSAIHHDGTGVFAGLPNPLHRDALPFAHRRAREPAGGAGVTAETDDGLIMGLAHRERPVHGVQFHPESIASEARPRSAARISSRSPRPTSVAGMTRHHRVPCAARARRGGRAARRGRSRRRVRHHDVGQRHAVADGRLPDGAARARRDRRRDHRRRAHHARQGAASIDAPPGAIDTVGTGGDGSGTLQHLDRGGASSSPAAACRWPSTATAISRRSRARPTCSWRSGVNIDADMSLVRRAMFEAGIGFLMAPRHHSATRHVGADAGRARHAHHLQPARADVEPGAGEAPAGRRVRAATG